MNRVNIFIDSIEKFAKSKIHDYSLTETNFWKKLLQENESLWSKKIRKVSGKRILIATSTGGHQAITPVESLLAVALTLRGAQVHLLLCDKVLPACLQATTTSFKDQSEFPQYGPQKSLCDTCFLHGINTYKPLELPIHLYSEFIKHNEQKKIDMLVKKMNINEIKNFKLHGLEIGEHAFAGALRYFARADISEEPYSDKVLKRYFHAALTTAYVTNRLLNKFKFDCAVFHHGIYIPQGIVGEVARSKNIRIVNWNPAYRKKCFIFSHYDTYHHTLLSEPVSKWENIKFTGKMEKKTMEYLKSRWFGTKDWIWFHEKPTIALTRITDELKMDFNKPCIGMLTNVIWDAQLHYKANAFPNMLDWIIKTIRYFIKRPELQLIIRIHPAEIRGTLPSRQKVAIEIQKCFPNLPKNIITIHSESQVSTYAVMDLCNAVLIYGTKTGVELTTRGIPVIVAGEAWIRNKGITMDAKSVNDYYRLLDELPLKRKMDNRMIRRARKYAYHFFFRRMIPINFLKHIKGWPPYQLKVDKLDDLLPGSDKGLDVICKGILLGKDFIYKDEKYEK